MIFSALSYVIFIVGFVLFTGPSSFPPGDVIHWVLYLALASLVLSLVRSKIPERGHKLLKWMTWATLLTLLTTPLREYSWSEVERQAYPVTFLSLFVLFDIFMEQVEKRVSSPIVLSLLFLFFSGMVSLTNLVSGSLSLGIISIIYVGSTLPMFYKRINFIGSEKYLVPFYLLTAGHLYSEVPLAMNIIYGITPVLIFAASFLVLKWSEKRRDILFSAMAIILISGGTILSLLKNLK